MKYSYGRQEPERRVYQRRTVDESGEYTATKRSKQAIEMEYRTELADKSFMDGLIIGLLTGSLGITVLAIFGLGMWR